MEEKNSEKKERKMRDSGIPWIGEVPEGGEFSKIKYHCTMKSGDNITALDISDNGEYPVYGGNGLRGFYKIYNKNGNHILIGRQGALAGNVHLVNGKFWATDHAVIVTLKNDVFINYFFRMLESMNLNQYAFDTAAQPGLSVSRIMNLNIVLPNLKEQHRIADFLDSKCSEIDTLIENLSARMESAKEYKKAVITEAVTKGLDKDAKMKDSGIEWIGKIPEGWKVAKLKQYIKNVSSGLSAVTSDSSEDSGKYILRTSAVSSEKFIESEVKSVTKQAESRLICPVEADTVIMSRMNTSAMVGACAYVARNYENLFVPDKLWKIKFTLELSAKYAWYLINSAPIRGWFSSTSTGASASMQNISLTDFYNAYAPIPRVIEQRQISDCLDSKCAEIDALLQNYEDQIATLEEYKKVLIYEYVTGKKEVPAV